ncbi:MAG TPA: ABC transporter permease [Terriglobia bacterium]|nr:ABC transporter permease [Terriglobia bacterium]
MAGQVLSYLKRKILAIQDGSYLLFNTLRAIVTPPRYHVDTLMQMDSIGVGSLPIVLLTGFFTGAVLAVQTYRTLTRFGSTTILGEAVALSVVRELGPVLTALVVAGRVSSGIASEIGSMLVSEQIDALRAMGTDPQRKLVAPRLLATIVTLPLLTILSDFVALLGAYIISLTIAHLTSAEFWSPAYQSLDYHDVTQGLLKPFFFAIVIALVGCFQGLETTGGTEGVGKSTTQAVVVASVVILVLDFFITQFLIGIGFA